MTGHSKLIILSDIHANLTALDAVLHDIFRRGYQYDSIIILGDIINYGMRPNETIDRIKDLGDKICVNIMGNHEKALLSGDLSHFSTERGKQILNYTASILSPGSKKYLIDELNPDGILESKMSGKKILFMHGNIGNPFWGKMTDNDFTDLAYMPYDYVFSGHSHQPHYRSTFFKVDNPAMRNKKKTIFVNPGSVGQPRNHNPMAQYAYVDLVSETVHNISVPYDVDNEYNLYPDSLDSFYRERLKYGI